MISKFKAGVLSVLILAATATHASMREYFYLSKHQPVAGEVELIRSFITTATEDSTGYSSTGSRKDTITNRKHVTTEKLSVDTETALYLGCICGNLDIIEYSVRRIPHGNLTKFSTEELLSHFDQHATKTHPAAPAAVIAAVGTALTAYVADDQAYRQLPFAEAVAMPWHQRILTQKDALTWGAGITSALAGLVYFIANGDYQRAMKARAAIDRLHSDIQ